MSFRQVLDKAGLLAYEKSQLKLFLKADIHISDIFHTCLNADRGLGEVTEGRGESHKTLSVDQGRVGFIPWFGSLGFWGGDRTKGALQEV